MAPWGAEFMFFVIFRAPQKNMKKRHEKGRHYDGFDAGSGGMRGATGGLLGGQKQARLEPRVSARPSSPAKAGGGRILSALRIPPGRQHKHMKKQVFVKNPKNPGSLTRA